MKKFASAVIAVLILFTFCSCSLPKETALIISGTKIDSEIFTYFLDKVVQRPTDYGLTETPKKDDLKHAVINECKEYIVINTEFRNRGLSLSAADKVEISDNVNYFWVRFENHYNEIGISKQTVTKIMTSQAYEDALFTAIYDRGTENEAAEKELTDYFYSNYISFRNVCAYFTSSDGSTPMTQQEKNELLAAFDTLAKNSYADADKLSEAVTAAGYTLSDSTLLKKDSSGYPAGFFEKVYAQADGTVQIIVYDECVFAVWKENLKEKGESIYPNYRSSCISDLYSVEASDMVNEQIEALTVEEKRCVDRIVNKFI